MSNCSYPNGVGNSTTGQCMCDTQSWKGGDCGLRANQMMNGNPYNLTSTGPTWFSLYYNPGAAILQETVTVTIKTSAVPLTVYVSAGWESDPNKFEHGAMFAGLTSTLTLNSAYFSMLKDYDGFAISIYVDGIATKANTLLENSIEVSLTSFVTKSSTQIYT